MNADSINDGGPAFPREHNAVSLGMSLRDYFAAKAMHAQLNVPSSLSMREIAERAYFVADAMLKARNS